TQTPMLNVTTRMVIAVADPEMYPGTDYPSYTQSFESFDDLRGWVEDLNECLNFIVSWYFPELDDIDEHGSEEFSLLIFMPRKSLTHSFTCPVRNGRGKIDAWLQGYVKDRTMRWYGWNGGTE